VNTRNVANLVPAWSFSFGGEKQRGQEGQALVHDGVIYATSSYSRIFAIDARSGKRLWNTRPACRRHPPVLRRGQPRPGDLRRQDLLRHPRRQHRGPQQGHRQGGGRRSSATTRSATP
jgi:hypothetical protein